MLIVFEMHRNGSHEPSSSLLEPMSFNNTVSLKVEGFVVISSRLFASTVAVFMGTKFLIDFFYSCFGITFVEGFFVVNWAIWVMVFLSLHDLPTDCIAKDL